MDIHQIGDELVWFAGIFAASAALVGTFVAVKRRLGLVQSKIQILASNVGMIPALATGQTRIESKLSRLQEVHRAAISSNGDVAFEADVEGRVIWASRAFVALSGRLPQDLLGYGWFNVICYPERDTIGDQWLDAVREKRDFQAEFCFLDRDGDEQHAECHAAVLRDGDCVITGYFGTITVRRTQAAG